MNVKLRLEGPVIGGPNDGEKIVFDGEIDESILETMVFLMSGGNKYRIEEIEWNRSGSANFVYHGPYVEKK